MAIRCYGIGQHFFFYFLFFFNRVLMYPLIKKLHGSALFYF